MRLASSVLHQDRLIVAPRQCGSHACAPPDRSSSHLPQSCGSLSLSRYRCLLIGDLRLLSHCTAYVGRRRDSADTLDHPKAAPCSMPQPRLQGAAPYRSGSAARFGLRNHRRASNVRPSPPTTKMRRRDRTPKFVNLNLRLATNADGFCAGIGCGGRGKRSASRFLHAPDLAGEPVQSGFGQPCRGARDCAIHAGDRTTEPPRRPFQSARGDRQVCPATARSEPAVWQSRSCRSCLQRRARASSRLARAHRLLPAETRAYVRLVTGRTIEEWTSGQNVSLNLAAAKDLPCDQGGQVRFHRIRRRFRLRKRQLQSPGGSKSSADRPVRRRLRVTANGCRNMRHHRSS